MAKAIAAALSRDLVKNRTICNLIGVMSFMILTTVGAYTRIPLPFTPVPITLQTFFVVLAGTMLGARLGTISQAGYLALGAAGLPVFQNYGSGIAHIAGPTCGYLLGFMLAPLIAGKVISLKRNVTFGWAAFSMAVGSFAILFLGTVYLMNFLHIGLKEGILLGTLYFLPGDFVKIVCGAYLYLAFNKRIRNIFKIKE